MIIFKNILVLVNQKLNYYKTSYLSHNTFTFLLTNRQCVEGIIKKDKKILRYLLNRDY